MRLNNSPAFWLASAMAVASLAVAGCGRPHNPAKNPESEETGIEDDGPGGGGQVTCIQDADCPSGQCNVSTGLCESGPEEEEDLTCSDRTDCGANEYCQFEDPPVPWEADTTGVCSEICSENGDCPFGQLCSNGVCYTQIDCDPELNNEDCPPGEVCADGMCGPPPESCVWPEDCPSGWVCNVDNTCINPDDIQLGGCSTAEDCNAVEGCANGTCTCNEGACEPLSGCESWRDCEAGAYCAEGYCRPADTCDPEAELDECFPLGLRCESGYCVDPDPCEFDADCDQGFECKTNIEPPGCFPQGTAECNRDEQCPADHYCEAFTGTCEPGCRSNADCEGECGDSDNCVCDNNHVCSDATLSGPGESCTTDEDCVGGTRCAYTDPQAAMMGDVTCGTVGPIFPGMCDKSCRQTCNLVSSAIMDDCPQGETCGGDSNVIMKLVNEFFGGLISPNSGGSVCYPNSNNSSSP